MTVAREKFVKPGEPGFYHCISRVVRRAFLLGEDPYSGKNSREGSRIEDRGEDGVIVKTFDPDFSQGFELLGLPGKMFGSIVRAGIAGSMVGEGSAQK